MTPDFFERFFAVLALTAATGAVGFALCWLLRGRVGAADELRVSFAPYSRLLAWVVAAVATCGSLYFSEVAHFVPCHLCWAQRACMYPMSIILLVGAFRPSTWARLTGVVLAIVGAGIATYHYIEEWFPKVSVGGVCDVKLPCSYMWFQRIFGFVSMPFMALSGFLAIVALLALPLPTES